MYAIYGNIYHQYTQMLVNIPYMDPMGHEKPQKKMVPRTWRKILMAFTGMILGEPRGPGHRLRYRTGLWRCQNPPSSKHLRSYYNMGKTYGKTWSFYNMELNSGGKHGVFIG